MSNNLLHINTKSAVPKYRQVMEGILASIETNRFGIGDKLPSINQLCHDNAVKRDTVMYALNELKALGILTGKQGKGYYLCSNDLKIRGRFFLLFDELNAYTQSVFNTLHALLPEHIQADIFFHHHNAMRIRELLSIRQGYYTSYILEANGLNIFSNLISRLPGRHICMIGKTGYEFQEKSGVYHDLHKDMYESLRALRKKLRKYCRLVLLHCDTSEQSGWEEGFLRFCGEENFEHRISNGADTLRPALYEAYFVTDDTLLVKLIAQIRDSDLVVGENIGLVSFGDSLMKEVTLGGLTTISHDYHDMCLRLIDMAQGRKRGQVRIRSKIIQRNSL